MLVVLIAKLKKKTINDSFLWCEKHGEAIKECKSSVISSNNSHHGSLGKYFSFGNSAIYKTVNKSSVGQYTTKRGLTVVQKVKSHVIEDLVLKELKDGIESLGSVIPLLKEYIAPVFQIAHELQATVGDINLKKDKYSEFGIWKSVFCINARTSDFHTEDDCSYTVITVPRQKLMSKEQNYQFLFKFNSLECISLEMKQPITFMFSGKCLLHRQATNKESNDDCNSFYNFATYTNKKIFSHVKQSLIRNK